jgi:hypothetical protein
MVFSTFCHFRTISGQLTARCRKKQVAKKVTAKKIGGATNVKMILFRHKHKIPKCCVIRGRLILESIILETGWKNVEWIYLAQDSAQWQTFVNTVINLRVVYKAGIL